MTKEERLKLDEYLKSIVLQLPDAPGCYQYLDAKGNVIYVGKAKNLRRRVSSYFHNPKQTHKTAFLVPKIHDIRYVVVKSENDALLLENNLIKKYKPHYNVLLKDDKTYPSIAITDEYLPRIFSTRNRNIRNAQYFGPYSHLPTMHAMLELCRKLYHPRPCRTPMNEQGIQEGKYHECLEYHLQNCGAPCIGRQSRNDYMQDIEACREILKGRTASVARKLKTRMMELASALRFEEAEEMKQQYLLLESFREKSEIVSPVLHNIDVFHIESEEKVAYINYLHVTNGAITQAFTFEYKKRIHESDEELLVLGIVEMRERYASSSKEIVVPFHVELPEDYATQTIPQKGDKRKLLELSRLNVKQYRFDRLKQAEKLNPEQRSTRLMKELQRELGLDRLPLRIELFDNSNLAGTDAVAACIVFEKLRPSKKEYRKYIIRSVTGPDDYASMREVVLRRYTRLKAEGTPLPDLIIADGGQGQMEIIRGVVEDELALHIPIAGLVKDGRHRTRELLFGFPPANIGLKAHSQLFRLLTQMQDEVHRFAITFHRQKRSKRQTKSELDMAVGIGEKSKTLLFREFGSVKRIKEAPLEHLQTIIGKAKGQILYNFLHPKKTI